MKQTKKLILKYLSGKLISQDIEVSKFNNLLRLVISNAVALYYKEHPEEIVKTSSKGNTWFEVDVPEDINTRLLIFNTVGLINPGSLNLNALRESWKSIQSSK